MRVTHFFAGMELCSEGHQVGHRAWVTLCRLRRGLRYQGASFPLPGFVFFVCGPEIENRNQDIGKQRNCTEDGPVLPAGGGYCSVGNSDRGKEDQQHQNGQSDDGEDDE